MSARLCKQPLAHYNAAYTNTMKHSNKLLELLTPSWLVNLIGLAVGILTTATIIVISSYEGSDLKLQVFQAKTSSQPGSTSVTYDYITKNIADNSFFGALPLLLVWAGVGLMIYFIAMSIARSISQASELRDELNYVHVSRDELLRQNLIRLGLRAAAIFGWIICIVLSVRVFVPYALAAAHVAGQGFSLNSVKYAVLAVAVLYAVVYTQAIFLRLIALRPRLFNF